MKRLRPYFEIILFATLIGLANFFLNKNTPIADRTSVSAFEIPISTLESCREKILFIDARNLEEYSKGHIKNSINLSEDQFNAQIDAFIEVWTPSIKVVVYCNPSNCNSSREVAKRLLVEYNLKNIFILKGDWREWKD